VTECTRNTIVLLIPLRKPKNITITAPRLSEDAAQKKKKTAQMSWDYHRDRCANNEMPGGGGAGELCEQGFLSTPG
jgi:hypothetical protein